MNYTNYFRVITHFGTDKINNIYIVEHSDNFIEWKEIYKSYSNSELIGWLSNHISFNNLCNCFHLIADFYITREVIAKVVKDTTYGEEKQYMTPTKLTAKPVNYDFKIYCNTNSYIIHTNEEHIAEATEIIEAFAFIAHQIKKKDMKSYRVFIVLGGIENQFIEFNPDLVINTYGDKFNYGDEDDTDDSVVFSDSSEDFAKNYDDEEITKDLMLDEVISSQKLEINRLLKIIEDQQSYIMTLNEHSSHMAKELMSVFQKMIQNKQ